MSGEIEQSGRPRKGEPGFEVWVAAIDVALEAPLKQGKYVGKAGIPWEVIHELRAALDAAGIDWRKHKAKQDAERRELRRWLDGG